MPVSAVLLATGLAFSGLQRPAIGEPAPLPALRDLAGVEHQLRDLSGPKGLVLFFWSTWSERSLEEFRELDAAAPGLVAKGVGVAAINVEHQTMSDADAAVVKDAVEKAKLRVPVLLDVGLVLFRAYGVVSVPSTALVDGTGTLVHFEAGFGHSQRQALVDRIDAMAGIEHKLPVEVAPEAAPAALRRLRLGRSQLARGLLDAARASFETAAAADPTYADPLVALAALSLDAGDHAAAAPLLDKAVELKADHRTAAVERLRLALVAGRTEEAEHAAEVLAAGAPDDALASAYVGYVLVASGRAETAAAAFDRAAAACGLDPRKYLEGQDPMKAMAAFRRALAGKGR